MNANSASAEHSASELEGRASQPPLPHKPNLVLRIGFAGNRNISDDAKQTENLSRALDAVLKIVARQLAAISASAAGPTLATNGVSFYSEERPKLRLITGLAEGADALAAQRLLRLPMENVGRELAAVLPFDVQTHRESRSNVFRPLFDELAKQCAYVLALDGHYEAGEAGKGFRSRAYRAQSTLLLRHSDILMAILDPDHDGKAGGTMETIHVALAFDLPVVFIHAGTGAVRLLESGSDLVSALSGKSNLLPSRIGKRPCASGSQTSWRDPMWGRTRRHHTMARWLRPRRSTDSGCSMSFSTASKLRHSIKSRKADSNVENHTERGCGLASRDGSARRTFRARCPIRQSNLIPVIDTGPLP